MTDPRTQTVVPRIAMAALAALALLASARAQAPPPAASALGSPAASAAAVSTDYQSLVAGALPPVTAVELSRRVREAAAEAAAEKPLAPSDARSWAALFDLRIDATRPTNPAEVVDSEEASTLADPDAGRFYVAIRHAAAAPVPREAFKKILPDIRRAHAALAARIGIPGRQVFFTDFREILAQSTPAPKLPNARESAIESAGATSTLLRSVGGLVVDGSQVRITSLDAARVEMVDVRWPRLRIAPEVDERSVLAPASLADRITRRVAAAAAGKPVSVQMAVVLRPLHGDAHAYFVPALRVGIKPKSEKLQDGYRTDAGERFYVDLVAGLEGLADREERDLVPESLERKDAGQ